MLAWVLVRLGVAGELERSFRARLKAQKAVYLLQALGFPTDYGFNIYLRGPYSRELADDYMALAREGLVEEYARYAEVDEARWGPVVDRLAAEDALVLEVAATLLDLIREGWPLEEARARVAELKPYVTGRLLGAGERLLRELGLL